MEPGDHAYGPIGGTDEMRTAIAEHYNRLFREGKPSKYTAANVSVAAGGRLMLTRVFAALDRIKTTALRRVFSRKRNLMVKRLGEMGVRVHPATEGTFYCWASLSDLPEPLRDGHAFFRAALQRKVMTVPGDFFDVNPGKRRRAVSELDALLVRAARGQPSDGARSTRSDDRRTSLDALRLPIITR